VDVALYIHQRQSRWIDRARSTLRRYLWDALLDAMAEFEGRPAGVDALLQG